MGELIWLKRSLRFFFVFSFLILVFPTSTFAANLPNVQAKSYILMDPQSGAILAQKSMEEQRPPASMTKMMSEFIVLDKIKSGEITWEEKVTVSPRAAKIDEAQIHLAPGEKMSVKELYIATAVQSANDAVVALAEHIGGSEEQFVEMMNQKAQTLGMKNTHYCNSSGLGQEDYADPPECDNEHYMSAQDSAILATQLTKTHPEVIDTTSISHYTFHKGTSKEQKVTNWNKMLTGLPYAYEGVDGFKTGHTDAAGYCFTGSAIRGDMRLITVVMGTANESKRFSETKKLLDLGFENFELRSLLQKAQAIPGKEKLALPNGVEREVAIGAKENIVLPVETGKEKSYTLKLTPDANVKAPLTKGQVIGRVDVLLDGKPIPGISSYEIVATESMEEGSWFRLTFRSIGDEISSWFK